MNIYILDVEMDITEPLDILDSESFTMIIDKATFDCVACSDLYSQRTKQMLDNIHRVLAPGGTYILVSYGRPETRIGYLQPNNPTTTNTTTSIVNTINYKWTVET